MDQHTDVSKGTFNLIKQAVKAVDMSKTAAAIQGVNDALPASSYGDPNGRLYPVHTQEDSLMSAAYAAFAKNAGALENIYRAGKMWGNEALLREIAGQVQDFEQPLKFAMDLVANGVHYQLFPYTGIQDIKEAAEAFYENRHKLPWAAREKTATVIFEDVLGHGGNEEAGVAKEAFEYITKAAGFGLPDVDSADVMLCQRWNRDAKNPAFAKVARILREIQGDPQWDKVAMEAFDALDSETNSKGAYGKSLRLPEEDLYVNSVLTAKTAADLGIVKLMNGKAIKLDDVDWAKVAEMDPVLYKEARGGVLAAEVLPTWPRPDADLLVEMLGLPLVEC